jgi:hypothetical protein
MNKNDIIHGATYYLKLTANENPAETTSGLSFTTEHGVDIFFTNALIEVMHELPLESPAAETTPRTCGECAHLRHLDPKKDSYNREAYAKRPWGDCHIYERSPEYQRMVENHFHGCGWRYAPGRSFDQPACQHFTPKKP